MLAAEYRVTFRTPTSGASGDLQVKVKAAGAKVAAAKWPQVE